MSANNDPESAPGPWILDESTGEIVDALGLHVAKLPVGTAEERASARLIAASPLLFAALEELSTQARWANLGCSAAYLAALERAAQALVLAEELPPDPERPEA